MKRKWWLNVPLLGLVIHHYNCVSWKFHLIFEALRADALSCMYCECCKTIPSCLRCMFVFICTKENEIFHCIWYTYLNCASFLSYINIKDNEKKYMHCAFCIWLCAWRFRKMCILVCVLWSVEKVVSFFSLSRLRFSKLKDWKDLLLILRFCGGR